MSEPEPAAATFPESAEPGALTRAVIAEQVVAWDAGDAEADARRVAPDVSFTNLSGW